MVVDSDLAYFAGMAYGDGYPEYGETRIVTYNEEFKTVLDNLVKTIAARTGSTSRVYSRKGEISDNMQHAIVLNSTTIRRALFDDAMKPRYDAMHSIALDEELAPYFQAGLTDAEGTLLHPEPIENPHGRIFAIGNNDRRLLGIARLSLVYRLRLEPTSVRIRLYSRRGRQHEIRGKRFINRKNNYVLEVLSAARRKWLLQVGPLLRHPIKSVIARVLLSTYSLPPDVGAVRG